LAGIDFYDYVDNSPVNLKDPTGMEPEGCTDCNGKPLQGLEAGKKCCSDSSPMSNTAPDPYPANYFYASVPAQWMFRHGGNGPWGDIVRGCLVCTYSHGVERNHAHVFCYLNGLQRTTRWQGFSGLGYAFGSGTIGFFVGNPMAYF
jgi:hypothetical protein